MQFHLLYWFVQFPSCVSHYWPCSDVLKENLTLVSVNTLSLPLAFLAMKFSIVLRYFLTHPPASWLKRHIRFIDPTRMPSFLFFFLPFKTMGRLGFLAGFFLSISHLPAPNYWDATWQLSAEGRRRCESCFMNTHQVYFSSKCRIFEYNNLISFTMDCYTVRYLNVSLE